MTRRTGRPSGHHRVARQLASPAAMEIQQTVMTRGLSLTEAADMIGLSRITLSQILNGRLQPSIEAMIRVSTVFGNDLDALVARQTRHRLREAKKRLAVELSQLRKWTPNMSEPTTPGEKSVIVHEAPDGGTVATVVQDGKNVAQYPTKEEALKEHPDAVDTELPPKGERAPND